MHWVSGMVGVASRLLHEAVRGFRASDLSASIAHLESRRLCSGGDGLVRALARITASEMACTDLELQECSADELHCGQQAVLAPEGLR
jgi:hypothetical protein